MDVELARRVLPELDVDFLVEKSHDCDLYEAPNELYLTFHGFQLPAPYEPRVVEMRIVIPPGYPQASLDMFYTLPWVNLTVNGQKPARADVSMDFHDGNGWQRWSRHQSNAWRPGVDGLRSYLRAVHSELAKGV